MAKTAKKTLYEVNIYCEMFYQDHEEWEDRIDWDLPDWNLIFITDKDPNDWSGIIEDAKEKHIEIKEFLETQKENIHHLHNEWIYPRDEGIYYTFLDEDDCLISYNWCGQD